MSRIRQVDRIRAHLESGHSITGLEASKRFGVGHLPRRILDLKESGFPIDSQFIGVTKTNGEKAHVKQYWHNAKGDDQ